MKKFAILGCVALLFAAIATFARPQDDETRKHVLHELGGPFIVSRPPVQEDLKLTDDQKQKLHTEETGYIQDTMQAIQKGESLPSEEREKEMQAHRQKSSEKFWVFLKKTLKPEQIKRMQQLELQHEGPGGLGRPDVVKALNITQGQLQQFMGVVQDLQKKVAPLMKEAQSGGNPQEIRAKVIKIREAHQGSMEMLLDDGQRKQWKEMLGKPLDTLND